MRSLASLCIAAAAACAASARAALAGAAIEACTSEDGRCDDDAAALLQRQRQSSSLDAASQGAGKARSDTGVGGGKALSESCAYSDALKSKTELIDEQSNPDGGSFQVWKFPLSFGNYTVYWRRFSVDVPQNPRKACGSKGCPILVSIPGSMGSVYSHRYWSKWDEHQKKTKSKFILVTVEGSPDAVAYAKDVVIDDPENYWSATSWNILGWGKQTEMASGSAESCTETSGDLLRGCFPDAAKPNMAYMCFGTQQAKDPRSCRPNPRKKGHWPVITTACASATAANDWEYMKHVLGFVVNSDACRWGGWCGNRNRIYLTGQSMGGMGALQWATPDPASDYFLGRTCEGDLRPSAVVGCSAGGSRNNDLDLRGEVPTLVMQGSADEIAPATPIAGYLRVVSLGAVQRPEGGGQRESDSQQQSFLWAPYYPKLMGADDTELVQQAITTLDLSIDLPNDDTERTQLLLQADAQSGGTLLESRLQAGMQPGCPAKQGGATAIAGDYYMWETLNTTVQRVVGSSHPVNMSTLTYTTTTYPKAVRKKAEKERFQCADVGGAVGLSKEVRVCVFNGGHTYPFLAKTPEVLHEYIWENFLKGGKLK